MVQLMNSGMESDTKCRKKLRVKLEVDDSLEDQLVPLNKRSKTDSYPQWNSGPGALAIPPSMYNPLDEPSPLGLRLRKSPSLLDLIQMKLSQQNASKLANVDKKDHKGTNDKLKASNFPGSILKIGTWEYKSRYEGGLVAKCYFAKHKLVWEVLDGGLKNKIEIQWSDIVAIKANYPDDELGTLDVVLARRPLFFRETNPQPRKHTLWQATSDFTGGQASIHRRHFLKCPPGTLGKHFEKLIQCDPRLNFLSQQHEIVLDCPFFEPGVAVFEDLNESSRTFDLNGEARPAFLGLGDVASPSQAQSSSTKNEQDYIGRTLENFSQETSSPSSVMDTNAIEEIRSIEGKSSKLLSHLDQIKVPGLHPSMSMSDIVSHIGNCIAEQMTSENPIFSDMKQHGRDILEEITQYLFSDSQLTSASDEQSLMLRVNSLCCLLQKDPSPAQKLQAERDVDVDVDGNADQKIGVAVAAAANESKPADESPAPWGESIGVSGCKQPQAMSRKDSFADLLLNLPRIASLPQFLFSLPEDSDNQAR